ncbi:hypothetical protein [Paenibacillus lautus]|uniref:hypothetical protein n=1 Tax=Paenibacillus lautus TaxID=1401 RepID=UPI003D9AA6F5
MSGKEKFSLLTVVNYTTSTKIDNHEQNKVVFSGDSGQLVPVKAKKAAKIAAFNGSMALTLCPKFHKRGKYRFQMVSVI